MAAPLHDMGKIAIPDSVLMKAGPLTADETDVMRRHPKIGHQLLSGSQNRFIQAGAVIALRHHERYDGSGYPDGLVGEEIPLEARIVAVADVFDALICRRVYKPPMPFEQARSIIAGERGRQFDPDVTDAFLAIFDELRGIAERYGDSEESLLSRTAVV